MQIKEQVREFIVENFLYGNRNSNLKDNESFLDSGIVDSTGILELVGFVEESFQIDILDEELVPDNLDSIEKVTFFVKGKQKVSEPNEK